MPCRNGGTCIDLPEDKHVCVCPNCGCSTEEPYDNCTIGMPGLNSHSSIAQHICVQTLLAHFTRAICNDV